MRGENPPWTFDANGFLDDLPDVVASRLALVYADPRSLPWLLRAIVLRVEQRAIGLVNFHTMPDANGRVEFGYEISAPYRRQGYAREATTALLAWGAAHGARVARACIAPDNVASKATLVGFTHVGEQIDAEDGLEHVFERVL